MIERAGNFASPASTAGPRGQGRDFRARLHLANYTIVSGSFPTANVFLDDGLSSPLTKETALSAGRQLGGERGSDAIAGYALLDLAVNYQVPVWQAANRG